MNINSLESFIQQTFNKTQNQPNQRSQNDIAASIGNAKSQQTQKAQLALQIQQTLQQRQNNTSSTTVQPVKPQKDNSYSFSIYV